MPVFGSKSEAQVRQGRRMVVANTLRHLESTCEVLGSTKEAGSPHAKNVLRYPRNTKQLRAKTEPCVVCFPNLGSAERGETGNREARIGWAPDVNLEKVAPSVVNAVAANQSTYQERRAAAVKSAKEARQKAKASSNAKAKSTAAKAKAARKRKPRQSKPAATAQPAATQNTEQQEQTAATA